MFTSWLRRLGALVCFAVAVLGLAARAHAADAPRLVVVIPVSGLIDPANESLILTSIKHANAQHAALIVLQVNSRGATDVQPSRIVAAVTASPTPVAVWVGPSGGRAKGLAAELAVAAPIAGMSNGAHLGPADPVRMDRPDTPETAELADQLAALAARNGRDPGAARQLATTSYSTDAARSAGLINVTGATLVEFIGNLDGRSVATSSGNIVLSTLQPTTPGSDKRALAVRVQLVGMGLGEQLSHALTSPSIAYLLLVAGFALIVFEFFAASIGIAGVVGALCLVAAFTGFGHLPMHWLAVALIAFGVFGFAIDVQVGRFGFWSVIGFIAACVGSLFLYGGASALQPAWWVVALVLVGLVVFMLGGMTAIVRTRFSTSTLGREGLVGQMGTADVDIDPDGVARIADARWTARTNRATPIKAGEALRVVAVEGFVLEVEPETGGAKDYRDRARTRNADASPESGPPAATDPA